MKATVEKMEAQLRLWSRKIDHLAAKTQKVCFPARFDDLIYIDELKALYAIAHLKFNSFIAAGDTEQSRLKVEMKTAWDDLEAAFQNPKP